ncbi:MAG: ABC transporter permease [Acidobacteria bacterium]|nr:ABC transporter permease [Acidobacteriota bacterium]
MRRVAAVAHTEVLALVRTKFFVISLFFMPIVGAIAFGVMGYASRHADTADRRFAVVDRTGVLYPAIAAAAARHNREGEDGASRQGPHFLPVSIDADGRPPDDVRLELSRRVREKDVFAFVEIPAGVLRPGSSEAISYYSENTSYESLRTWLRTELGREIERRRFEAAGVDPSLVPLLIARPEVATFALIDRRADGGITPARRVDELERFGVPMFFLVLMFMTIMSNGQHLIHTIIEEKMSKISEVLLGSISAFKLLLGKLLGIAAVTFVLALVYLAVGVYAAASLGRLASIDPWLVAWFLVFLLAASLMYGAVFQALSSACSDLKDAQSMLQPAMMLLILAYISSFVVIRAPDSPVSVALSFVPPITPFAMLLRIAMPPGPPLWQIVVSVVLLAGVTAAVVWSAGRIFRVGLLMQGKPPNLPELLRWIRY